MSDQQKTDLQIANQCLMELKQNVSTSDRKDAPASEATVIKYLDGNGKELDTAIKLLQYFRGRIEDRRKVLFES
jgi:hypothetical protein